MKNTNKLIFIALLVTIGLVLSIIEAYIPLPFIIPGAKLGLSNVVSLVTLVVFGFKEALIVGVIRSLTFVIATGSFSSLIYSLSGSIVSTITMFIFYKRYSKYFSLIGISILGAIFHNITQVVIGSLILKNIKVFSYLPPMLLISLFSGYFIGLTSIYMSRNLTKNMTKFL